MRLATTTGDFSHVCKTEEAKVAELYAAGFRYIDMSFYDGDRSPLAHDDYLERVKRLRYFADGLEMKFVQAHSPSGNPLCTDSGLDDMLMYSIRSIEACAELGIKNTVLHAGWRDDIGRDEYFSLNREFFSRLYPAMERFGVSVLVENSAKINMGGRYYLYDGEDMADFLDYCGHPLLGGCWDTGHANIEGHQYEDIMALGSHLKAIHFNDNRGVYDEHIYPFCGTMSIDDIMHALIDSGYEGYFTLECSSNLRRSNSWLGHRRTSSRDDRLLNPPLELYRYQEKNLFKTAKYILEAYNLYEE
ncbi:MAG: sugar phosphate isomerase/epimerase [Clostridiales bacterium]|nr:sugar phosphate isomerase/epimerase [Clostridiales bacterium]